MLDGQQQLRLGPTGQVVGLDMGTLLDFAEAREVDRGLASELLPAAERGLLEAQQTSEPP